MSKVVGTNEILELLKISRATWNQQYRNYVIQIPSIKREHQYDYASVMKRHKERQKEIVKPRTQKIEA